MDRWIAPIVGTAVFLFGAALGRWNLRAWGELKSDSELDDEDRYYYFRRFRRRTQMAALLLMIGLMVAVGEVVADWLRHPALFAVYWGGVLVLLLWVVLLSIGDMAATTVHSCAALARVRQQQRALEEKLAEFRNRHTGSDGAPQE